MQNAKQEFKQEGRGNFPPYMTEQDPYQFEDTYFIQELKDGRVFLLDEVDSPTD